MDEQTELPKDTVHIDCLGDTSSEYLPSYTPRTQVGSNNSNWKGGVSISRGYRRIQLPTHPRATTSGYVDEHILIAEKALGRPLPHGAVVHHADRDGLNNLPRNLVICQDQAYHLLLHQRMRALKACGHAGWRRCRHCKHYSPPEEISAGNHQKGAKLTVYYYHVLCSSLANKKYRELKKKQLDIGRLHELQD